jgi:hypothetical protein
MESSTSTAVKPVTAVELATAADRAIAAETAVAVESTITPESPVAAEPTITTESAITAESVAIKEATAAETMEPRPGTDENAASKIIWAIESIGRASVGVIPVVTVGANRRWPIIARANSNADRHLRISPTRHKN